MGVRGSRLPDNPPLGLRAVPAYSRHSCCLSGWCPEGRPCPGPASGWPCRTFPARRSSAWWGDTPSRLYSGLSGDTGPEPGEEGGTHASGHQKDGKSPRDGEMMLTFHRVWVAGSQRWGSWDWFWSRTHPGASHPFQSAPFTSCYLRGDPSVLEYSAERDLASSLPSLQSACRHSVPGGCPALWGNVPFRASSPAC